MTFILITIFFGIILREAIQEEANGGGKMVRIEVVIVKITPKDQALYLG